MLPVLINLCSESGSVASPAGDFPQLCSPASVPDPAGVHCAPREPGLARGGLVGTENIAGPGCGGCVGACRGRGEGSVQAAPAETARSKPAGERERGQQPRGRGLDRLTWQASWRGRQRPEESRRHLGMCVPCPGSLQTQGCAGDGARDARRVRGPLRAGVHRVPRPSLALGRRAAHLGLPRDAGLRAGVRLMDERGLRVGAGNPRVPGGRMPPAGRALSGHQAPLGTGPACGVWGTAPSHAVAVGLRLRTAPVCFWGAALPEGRGRPGLAAGSQDSGFRVWLPLGR